jgi:outer membrane immunogenic protein
MRLTQKWVCGAFVAFSSVAFAADLPRPAYKAPIFSPTPVYSWTGFYVGIHGGYGWSEFSSADPVAGNSTAEAKGWLGGLQLGYNYQMGAFVIGAEGDYSWSDVKNEVPDPLGLGGGNASLKNDYFATLALRLGYAFDRTLLYAKGGAAWTRDKIDVTDGVGGFGFGTFDRTGWMLGAGVEYAFWNNFSAKLEYNFLRFGSITEMVTTGGGLTASVPTVRLDTHLLKVGLNYRFF